jgi:hypothetical protein
MRWQDKFKDKDLSISTVHELVKLKVALFDYLFQSNLLIVKSNAEKLVEWYMMLLDGSAEEHEEIPFCHS